MAAPVAVPELGTIPKTAAGARELYDGWAASYDEALASWDYPAPRRVATTLKDAGVSAGSRILDIGCGTGMSGEACRALGLGTGGGVVGVDISPISCDLALAKGCYEAALVANLEEPLPFADASFDAVACVGVLSYVEHFDVLFPEVVRVLRPRGVAVFTHRDDLWDNDDRGCRSAAEALEASAAWAVFVGEPETYMPNNPDEEERAKRIRVVVATRSA